MGESFSAQLSTGIATFSVPFALPKARGAAQPSLGLSYSSGSGQGLAGLGWDVGVPFIARQTDRGIPKYSDGSDWTAEQDRFVFNGGQELVPICTVDAALKCAGALAQQFAVPGEKDPAKLQEVMPAWSAGWQYFRPRVEGSFLRFFWHPNHRTWRVQDKKGVTLELGVPLNETTYLNGLERNPDNAGLLDEEIFRWHLVRQFDAQGSANAATNAAPVNVVVYRYYQEGGIAFLTDIYDTPAKSGDGGLASYAHHVRLRYESRTDPTVTYRSGWRMEQKLRLSGVDVTSHAYNSGSSSQRHLVRRYHLAYAGDYHQSLLESVQVEGRCGSDETAAPAEGSDGALGATGCPRLPPMVFGYQHVQPFTVDGKAGTKDLPGYEGFDERLQKATGSPKHSLDEELTDLFDVNSDGLPDILVTAPGLYNAGHAVFFNGASGANGFGSATAMGVQGVNGADAATITLRNLNVSPLNLDGDGRVNFLHMPRNKTYAIYDAVKSGGNWSWVGRAVTTANRQDPKIDFAKGLVDVQVLDVNFDGLVNVVVSTGTEYQTFFSLGRMPGGDGQFGQGEWTGATTARLRNNPVTQCVPWAGLPVRFSDKETKLADMNGDGITDIVRLQRGQNPLLARPWQRLLGNGQT
ncbi:MAG: SpvB/TcaC N-terminal domain-containing protein [Polyangiaceae bacterium]